jgi:hypothetical protein
MASADDLNHVARFARYVDDQSISRTENHLATLYIDGNAMGEFFRQLAQQHPDAIDEMSSATNQSMVNAVDGALLRLAERVAPSKKVGPFEVHVLGGDDVLVTVPAAFGLTVAQEIINDFSVAMATAAQTRIPQFDGTTPTASAGVVIAHKSQPISVIIDLAESLLVKAKRGTQGNAASLCWTDTTRYGLDDTQRVVLTNAELEDMRPDVASIRQLGHAARTKLTEASSHPHPAIGRARALVEFERRRRSDLAHLADDPSRLANLIDLARWWY